MTTETYTPTQELAGSEQPHFAKVTIASGQSFFRLTPLGQKSANGEVVAWDPEATDGSQKAVFLGAFDTDTAGGSASKKVIKSGHWNSDLIAWPENATSLHKALAFVGTPISHEPL